MRKILASWLPFLLAPAALAALAPAQTTYTVQFGGGPGIDFPSLPPAVAAAADGDTILVLPSPFLVGAEPFTTSKGLTILGVGGAVPIGSSPSNPFVVQDLPAGSTFRMEGFENPFLGAVYFRIEDCAGQVHLEDLRADEPTFPFPSEASFGISNSHSVVLRGIQNFGSPAVSITGSTALLSSCFFGGIASNSGLLAEDSEVVLVDSFLESPLPGFQPSGYCVRTTQTNLAILGDGDSQLIGHIGSAVETTGGSVRQHPAVNLASAAGFAEIAGTAAVQVDTFSSVWCGQADPGAPLELEISGAPGALAILALGVPSPLTNGPLGLIGIDTGAPIFFLPGTTLDAAGRGAISVGIPASAPGGVALAVQPIQIGAALEIGSPLAFLIST